MSGFEAVTKKDLERMSREYSENRLAKAMTNALSKHNIKDIAFSNKGLKEAQFQFSVDLKTMSATNQKKSGRCWIFSALNVLREVVAKKCNIEKFELSQNYVAFWDKYEKANYFLESMIDLADRPATDRLVTFILDMGIQDGGQWDMFVNAVSKYGVVPKSAMEESFQSSNTADMNHLINTKLRKGAVALRKAVSEGKSKAEVKEVKNGILSELYNLFCMCFGEPPVKFDFEYTDKDKNYHVDRSLDPKSFYDKYIGFDLENDFVSIINSPTEDKPFYERVTIDYLGNVAEGRAVSYINLPMEEVKELIVKQLKDGEPVWFGSDVGHMGEREMGIWSDGCYDFDNTLGIDFSMTKAERLNYRESAMNHAMVITGVNLDENGKPDRWKIENSWSEENGNKGYYIMNAGWFDKFVYQAVVRKKHLNEKQLEALGKEPIHFSPWDPMGTLAD